MAETKKYVRIKKAKFLRNWYSVYIGRTYIVIGENESEYITHVGNVLKEDAELVVTEKRPAKVGEHVLITNPSPIVKQAYEAGDVFDVAIADDPIPGGVKVVGLPSFIAFREYEVIVNNEVKNEEADGMENVNQTAIDSASTVFEKVGEDYIGSKSRFGDILIGAPYSEAFVKAYANERKDVLVIPKTIEYTAFLRNEEMKKVAKSGQEAIKDRAQARRDEIVEQAKADVEELSNYGDGVRCETGTVSFATCNVEFVVKRGKRTVVALLKGVRTGKVYAKGIAKAASDDCFNVHLGKAIALRRALGLAVPDEYLNAPQPSEVRVGDVVYYSRMHPRLTVSEGIGKGEGFVSVQLVSEYLGDGLTKIIDDSREEVCE
ncbi:hypothetical protein AB0R79_18090 [Bacillus velezensis]|uniref:hypothetical protein n=1 Tax=Bacillus velezensis TaxID=492670 RepID=UPI003453E56F